MARAERPAEVPRSDLTAQAAVSDIDAVYRLLETRPEGLGASEAVRRRGQYGPNEVRAAKRSLSTIVREQVLNGINALLALAGVLTFVVGSLADGAIILGLLTLNIALSIVQEYRAERALEALQALLPLKALVRRDGSDTLLQAREVVPGDVVTVETGDVVPADLRLVAADGLEVNQATLTGESLPQAKDVAPVPAGPPASWTNTLFAGTIVASGQGRGIAVATGERTQFGETASLVRDIRTPSDFQVNLTRFGGFLLRFGLALAAVVFAVNALLGRGIVISLTLGLALMLGAVPEALPAVTATSLALGAAYLAQKKVLVRRLAAVEDISVINTLCVDKTGTITENRTVVSSLWTEITAQALLEAATLCSSFPHQEKNMVDEAIVTEASAKGVAIDELTDLPRHTIMPFSSQEKRMGVAVERPEGKEVIWKGAAEVIVQRCRWLRTPSGDVQLAEQAAAVQGAIAALQRSGARVIAVAVARDDRAAPEQMKSSDNWTLLGIIGLADPPREGAKAALEHAEELRVRVKIVTGDALGRAVALADQIGMHAGPGAIVDAAQLRGPQAEEVAERGRIFAGVVPTDKFHLVRALQRRGDHVGMTGDGVNDAPALRAADVGIAMASGSDAAREAADMVLLDDKLSVIVEAVAEGRRLFTNLNRYLLYTMVSNFANVVVVAIASLFLNFLPLLPEQVLALNVLADLPMLAIVTDRVAREDLATPRRWDVRRLVELTLYLGILNALFAFGLLRFLSGQPPMVVYSAWFLLLGLTALLILLPVRTPHWFWQTPPPSLPLAAAMGASLLMTIGLVDLPATQRLLGFAPLTWGAQAAIGVYALLYVFAADALKRGFVRLTADSGHPSPVIISTGSAR